MTRRLSQTAPYKRRQIAPSNRRSTVKSLVRRLSQTGPKRKLIPFRMFGQMDLYGTAQTRTKVFFDLFISFSWDYLGPHVQEIGRIV